MTETDEQPTLNYEVFDRQLENFYLMCHVFINGWEDYSTQEMTFDIRSLCTKASRLCYMADQDLALQHSDLAHLRKQQNKHHLQQTFKLLNEELIPFLTKVIKQYGETQHLEGHPSPMFSAQMSALFPKLTDFLLKEGLEEESLNELNAYIQIVEGAYFEKIIAAKYPKVSSEERLWNTFQIFSYSCYIAIHFQRVSEICGQAITDEEAGRLTEMGIHSYMQDSKGKEDIDRYFSTLEFNNNREPLTIEQLHKAQRLLQKEVPESLLLPFLHHSDNAYQLGIEVNHCEFTADEYRQLLAATTKWMLLECKIYEIQNPEKIESPLYNEVFVKAVNGRPVNMEDLKNAIGNMVQLISRKNQWFCVWSVLKHHNLLCNFSHEAFARQMMSDDWFGCINDYQHFSGDTLRDYKRYFSDYDYTQWDNDIFLEQKQLFGMTKWSNSLCVKFQKQCQEMEKAFIGLHYL